MEERVSANTETRSSSSSSKFIIEEWNGSSSSKLFKTATITTSPYLSIQRSGSRFNHVWRRILQAFVPEGFPSSVTPDYAPFQVWDSLQGLSTYIRTMLSTQALLSAIGVGEKSATVIGATFQWFLRDLTGMLGGILFTFYQGSDLDSNAKMWRLVADLMNDLGMLMDLLSPLFPSAFIFVVCLGSLSRSFTGVASGATRAALTQHFALQNNAADISAKEGSQETVATMIGMALGMILARITMGLPLAIWFSFLSLTVFHMYANYRAVGCLALTSLNIERSAILFQHFMETGQVLSPEQVSRMEHVLPTWITSWSSKKVKLLHANVHLGVRVSSLDHQEMKEALLSAVSHYLKAKYLLVERKGIIDVIMHKNSTASDVLQSFIHALVMAKLMQKSTSVYLESQSWMDKHYEVFLQKLSSLGWKTGRLLSPPVIWKAYWTDVSSDDKID
ncbi:protein root UVB sensitive 3 [Populus alba x Populus x berolinensis]|uniref:Protein root UVB sensitive 3 n=1 Tax=Populus alba x Populus x berolinensis TaxID=444605 RepID=A0AAD6MLZ9_9ROSI|nr:protein root UVB sensitive 3 [Populus alba x Populus x berolinensis]